MVMDHFHHHHHQQNRSRYASLPSQSHHHHHHHLPPPPPPPPLTYRTIHTPPPPPPYNNTPPPPPPPPPQSQQPQFPFYPHRPIEEEQRPISATNPHLHHHHHRPFSSSSRILPDDLLPPWNPSPDNRPPRNYLPIEFDRELHHHHPPPPPPSYPSMENPLRYDPERLNTRLRSDRIDEDPREGIVWGRANNIDGNYHHHHHRRSVLNSHSAAPPPSQPPISRDIDADSNSGGYVRVYSMEHDADVSTRVGRVVENNRRWMNDRKVPPTRELHDSSFELVSEETGKREYYGSEMVRYNCSNNCRGNNSRECGHEFTRTPPKKQIQKKSALLRLQTVKPSYRNRDVEQLRYATYAPESNSNFFRGKEQQHHHGHLGHEREGSPVELDISFESNTLVAKAIVAPSCSGAPVSDSNNMTSVSDADLTKKVSVSEPSTGVVDLNKSPCKAIDDAFSSGKDLNLQRNVSDSSSQPRADVTANCNWKNDAAVSVEGSDICSGKSSSSKVAKKKKLVKRVVKKAVVNPKSAVSNSPSTNALGGTVRADSVTLSSPTASGAEKTETCVEEKRTTTVDKVSVLEENVLTEDKTGALSLQSLGLDCWLQECKTDEDSDIGKLSRFERRGSISKSPSCPSSSEDKKSGSNCLDANNPVHDLLGIPNTDKVTNSLNGSTSEINCMDYDTKQFYQTKVSLSPGKYSNVGFPQNRNLVDVVDEVNNKLFSSADSVISTDLIDKCNSANDNIYSFNSNDLTGSEEKHTVNNGGNNGTLSEAYCENMAPTITKCTILEENSDRAIPLQSSGMVTFSDSGNNRIQDGLDCLQHASVWKQGSDNGISNLEDCITVHHSDILKNAGKRESPDDVTISPENCETEKTLPNSNISVGSDEGNVNKIKKRKVMTHLKFLSSKEGISPDHDNLVSQANDVYRGSNLLLKDPCPLEVLDQPVQRLDFNLQSSLDGVTALHGKKGVSEAEFYFRNNDTDDTNKVSPVSKGKKVTASHANSPLSLSEFSEAIVATTSNAEVPITFSDNQAHQKEVALSSMGILSAAQMMLDSEDNAEVSNSVLAGGSFESMDVDRETMISKHLELQHSDIVSYSPCEDFAFPNVQFSMSECEQKENITPIVPLNNTQIDILIVGNKGEKTDLQAAEETYQCRDLVQRFPRAVVEFNDLNMKDDLVAQQNIISSPANVDVITTSNSNDELIEDSLDALSDMCSEGMTSEVPDKRILEFTAIHDENICRGEENLNKVSVVEHGFELHTSSIQQTKKYKSDHAIGRSNPIITNIISEPSQVHSKVATQGLNSCCSELNGSKNQPGGVNLKTFQGHSFTFSKPKPKTPASSIQLSKHRTWHRTCNNPPTSLPRIIPSAGAVPPKKPVLERKRNFQNTSYIRKGNSLVRKPTPVSALPQISSASQLPLGLEEIQKSTTSESMADLTGEPSYLKRGETNAPQQRPKTPPLPIDTKSEEKVSSPSVEPPFSGCCEIVSDPRKFIEANDAPNSSENALKHYETPENQTGLSNNGENQAEANDGNISSLDTKGIVYMKPKTNQLVATSNSSDVTVLTDDKGQTTFSDGYYKRRKNQLVRTTFESQINQTAAMPNSTVNSDGLGVSKVLCNKRFTKRRSYKVAGSSCKPSRTSLVWTLRSKISSENDRASWNYQKVLPQLFPWKRATYLRSFIHNSASGFNSSSLPAVSKKLLLLRKRDTVYTRSTRGFSLWKSKVLGVGGSSLKWSKSIEKRSKQVNEEATLAVAAVERKKRERKDAASIGSQAKRERIFRIGSVRYRMDPSRRTLQRISDDESMSSASSCSGLAAKRTYIPRRLVIGNDEYVRVGNGNQLIIKDPKKRTRKLANEKVRWSLHTARQRLARKQKYCQFFTRFGKCNKDGGKCPYIHDPSKIAVCTKYLNGLCSTPNCKLTHKVIPERMPDCSYFLQGLCSNRSCPYRHVNVNPKASVCEGFLKGYCADGNECRKKHSYVCPTFEATGTCTQGTKCKLHHPKKQSKGKKRKRSGDHNSRGRYFGSIPAQVSEPGMMVAPRQLEQNEDLEKELSDYISLDVDEEVGDTADQSSEQSTFCDNDSLDLHLDTFDELIKPVLIIKQITSQSSQSGSLQDIGHVAETEGCK